MSRKQSLDEIIERAKKTDSPEFDSIAKELIILRSMVGDEETERWLFTQMRLNVMMNVWRKKM